MIANPTSIAKSLPPDLRTELMMIPQSTTAELRRRYRVLAGPFAPSEAELLAGLLAYLNASGARVVTVGWAGGLEVWRLSSEMETLSDTERRLRKKSRR